MTYRRGIAEAVETLVLVFGGVGAAVIAGVTPIPAEESAVAAEPGPRRAAPA